MTTAAALREPRFVLTPAARPIAPSFSPDGAQQQVLHHDRGALRVLGGPGTGKTRLIIEAVAARVQAGTPPEDLLVLTFAPSAARSMRDEITRRIGQVVTEPAARTVHAYAFGVLRHAALASGSPMPRLLPSAERDLMLREILAGRADDGRDRWPAELAAARTTRAFVEELQDVLMRAAERGFTPRELKALGRTHRRPEWIEAASVYDEYLDVTALQSPGAFDAPELIQRAIVALLDDPKLLEAERRRRRRLFVDEYTDLDPVQVQLLGLLSSAADEVIVTGDPDQSVFAFRGADPYAMSESDAVLGAGAHTVVLSTGYRTSAELVRAAHRVAERLPGAAAHRALTAVHSSAASESNPGRLTVSVFATAAAEASQIARTLRRAHLDEGIAWSDMAVVLRSTSTGVDLLRRQLTLAGVPVGRVGKDALPDEPIVLLFTTLLRRLAVPLSVGDDEVEALLSSAIGQADPLQLQAFRRRLRAAGQPVGTMSAMLEEPGFGALAGARLQHAVTAVQRVLRAGRVQLQDSVDEVLWALWHASGLQPRLERRSIAGGPDGARADRDLDAMLDLFAEANDLSRRSPGGTVRALLDWIEQLQIPDRPEAAGRAPRAGDFVQVLSAHAAKGRQWDVVCVAGVQEGSWPTTRRRGGLLGSDDLVDASSGRAFGTTDRGRQRLAEERRLFYVALTRARRTLLITAVSSDDQAPSRFLDEIDPPAAASQPLRALARPERPFDLLGLVGELRARLLDPATAPDLQAAAAAELARLAAADVAGADPEQWWGLREVTSDAPVRAPDAQLRISPSHLQGYLDCQMRALLEDLAATDGRNVIEASVGTLVHQIAEDVEDEADLPCLQALADERWPQLEFVAAWQSRTERARASRMLTKLAQWLTERRGRLELVGKEQAFVIEVAGVTLSGRIDRVERTSDGRVLVVDLKATKRTFSKSDVEGHAQLAVYQLAVQAGQFAAGQEPAGAALVHLGKQSQQSPELIQRPLAQQADADRIPRELTRLSAQLRAPRVSATLNTGCDFCPVQACCPLQDDGRHVSGHGGRQ